MKIGFVVNPVAGMGGAVGLKGTDGEATWREAVSRGARKTSPARAKDALDALRKKDFTVDFVTCAGEMGADELDASGTSGFVVHRPRVPSTREDTIDAAKAFAEKGADLILFAGGDGTARDLLDVVDRTVPIVGIPSGVKMQSSVFAVTPEHAADLVESYVRTGKTREAEVVDVDEESYRRGVLKARLFGLALVPDDAEHLQSTKTVYHSGTAEEESDELGQYLAETMQKGVLYIIGPGSTTESIARHLGQKKTLLGVDVYCDGRLMAEDAAEKQLLKLARNRQARVIVSPIGAQGFILGRGNQQISPDVIRMVGSDNVLVAATPSKLRGTPVLRVDTGDPSLDRLFVGRTKVVTGYKRRRVVRVE